MTLSSQMTDESRARKNSWKWGQVKLGKALTRVFQEGWKLEDVVTWPFPQETGEGSRATFGAGGSGEDAGARHPAPARHPWDVS